MRFATVLLTLCAVLIALPASAGQLKNYKGADAGYLVFSIATGAAYKIKIFQIVNKRVGATIDVRGPRGRDPDFETIRENDGYGQVSTPGKVHAIRLPPGHYTMMWVELSNETGFLRFYQNYFFELPFDVQTGETNYLGALEFAPSAEPATLDVVWHMNVLNEEARDIALARSALPGLPSSVNFPTTSIAPIAAE